MDSEPGLANHSELSFSLVPFSGVLVVGLLPFSVLIPKRLLVPKIKCSHH